MEIPDTEPGCIFASHLPVLEALSPRPKRVLEFGAGLYSTAAFLEMPSVTKLVSIEVYPDWREEVRAKFRRYKRWTLLDETDEVPPLLDFDLIFIDDGRNEQERLATITRVLDQPHPKTVIHDAEFAPFLGAIHERALRYVVHRDLTPHTAIIEGTP